jgi:hypothetical protein
VAAFGEQLVRVGFLEESGSDLRGRMCEAIASTGVPLRCASYTPLIKCRLPGPELPAHTASCPVTCASAAAANAAVSSCRTCTHSMPSVRRTASTIGLRLSPTMP